MIAKQNPARIILLFVFVFIVSGLRSVSFSAPESALLNTPAKPWQVSDWMNSPPIEFDDLRGKVIFVRWWTGPYCPYCRASAPAINQIYKDYHERGLEVIGFYHHKGFRPLDKEKVRSLKEHFHFEFPVAIDHEWRTLNNWWLNRSIQQWTSVTFLIDQKGIIRYIHPGGQYEIGDDEYKKIRGKIEELLSGEQT